MLMSLSLKKSNFQLVVKKNIYCLNLVRFKSSKLDLLSLKKKKSLLEFYLVSNTLKDQNFYIIENNIKAMDTKRINDCKIRKLVKTGVLLSNERIFNDKNKMKYFLRLLIFSNFNSLNQYFLTTRKQGSSLPSLIKVNFLSFQKVSVFLLYLVNFERLCINFRVRLKLITSR